MAELLDEIHPGEILLEDFMKPMGISARQLAADIDVSPSRISELVNGHRPVTAEQHCASVCFSGWNRVSGSICKPSTTSGSLPAPCKKRSRRVSVSSIRLRPEASRHGDVRRSTYPIKQKIIG